VTRKPQEEARRARTGLYRQHILDAAERVFADRGFDAAKVQEIADRAGMAVGTLYAIFPGKEDIFRAILDERGNDLLQLARDVAARRAPPREALRALSGSYVEYFVAHPDFLRMHLRLGTSWMLRPAAGTDNRARLWREIHRIQSDIFRRGIAEGVFVAEDPGYLARLFSAMDQALLSDWVMGGMEADRAQLVRRLHDLVDRAFCRTHAPALRVSSPAR
jgi:AcrR family transcriptional regulator